MQQLYYCKYCLICYGAIKVTRNNDYIAFSIKPGLLCACILAQLRGIIVNYAKVKLKEKGKESSKRSLKP